MNATVLGIGVLVLVSAVIAALFGALAWATGRRYGGAGIAVAWLLGTCAATAYGLYLYRFNLRIFGPPNHEYHLTVVLPFAILGVAAFGGAASAVRRYMRSHAEPRLSGGVVAASIGGFYLGTLVGFAAVFLGDIAHVVRYL